MVTDTDGYIHIIEYLTEHLSLFEGVNTNTTSNITVIEVIEEQLSEQIISVCSQNKALSFNQRNDIVREVDAILYDLEEILSSVVNQPVTSHQQTFICELATLIKNLFDAEIHAQLSSSN